MKSKTTVPHTIVRVRLCRGRVGGRDQGHLLPLDPIAFSGLLGLTLSYVSSLEPTPATAWLKARIEELAAAFGEISIQDF